MRVVAWKSLAEGEFTSVNILYPVERQIVCGTLLRPSLSLSTTNLTARKEYKADRHSCVDGVDICFVNFQQDIESGCLENHFTFLAVT